VSKNNCNYWKLAVAIALTGYYISYATGDPGHTYANWNMIDSADLIIHEGGHVIFSFFGEFIYILGGSLTQVLLPAIFVFYFFLRQQFFSGSVLIFWVAQNVLYVATYMGDSIRQQLPLLGGNEVIHDWNYLLTHMGLLQYTDVLSGLTRYFGFCLIACAGVLCVWYSFEEPLRQKIRAKIAQS
jgi:hypothetical protein